MKKITFLIAAFIFGTMCLTAVELPTSQLLVKYDFNGLTAASTTVPDLSTNAKNGDIIGTFDPATSMFPNAFYCGPAATPHHVKTMMNYTLDKLTVTLWYYNISAPATNNTIWSPARADAGTPKIEIISAGGFRSGMKKVAAAQWSAFPSYTPADITGKWVHVVATFDLDALKMKLYFNGVKESDIAITETKESYLNKIFINELMSIGAWYNSTAPAALAMARPTECYVDNFQMYQTVLTEEQIAFLAEQNPNTTSSSVCLIESVKANGNDLLGFNPYAKRDTIDLPQGTTTVPTLTITPKNSGASVAITNAADLSGESIARITSADGSFVDYKFKFNVLTTTKNNLMSGKDVRVYMANSQTINIEGFTTSSYVITNMAGQVYQEGKCINNSIKVSGINKGLFVVKLVGSDKEIVVKKLILN